MENNPYRIHFATIFMSTRRVLDVFFLVRVEVTCASCDRYSNASQQQDATNAVYVQLIAPRYVKYGGTATLFCNHSIPDNELHKVTFSKGQRKIFQYVRGRSPPIEKWPVEGAEFEEHTHDGKTIKLKNVKYEATGYYSCEASAATPIFAKMSKDVSVQVFVPQTEDPRITFKKAAYLVGEYLEANCSSSPARPVPHLTWFINGKEVDVTLVTHFPHEIHNDHLMSATAMLKIEVSELHAGDNGKLEISCHSTIPDYPTRHRDYADFRNKTVPVKIMPAPVATAASSPKLPRGWVLLTIITCIFCTMDTIIPS